MGEAVHDSATIRCLLNSICLCFPFQDEPYSIKLLGRAWQNIVYMRGWDELMPGAESLRAEVEEDEEEGLGSNRLFITLVNSITIVEACTAERLTPRTSDLEVRCF